MRLLDLFCGAGGCAVGYHRAGFTEIAGVDIKPQPRYPFRFVQADALEYLAVHGREFDAIHASPPCQRYSQATRISGNPERHPDLVAPTREALLATGRPYVIENVPGAPLAFPVLLCGLALGCGVKRHRLFESNLLLFGTVCPVGHRGDYISVFGHGSTARIGGRAPRVVGRRRRADASLAKQAMGIDWMNRDELSQAIPPAYTEWVGRQILQQLAGGES